MPTGPPREGRLWGALQRGPQISKPGSSRSRLPWLRLRGTWATHSGGVSVCSPGRSCSRERRSRKGLSGKDAAPQEEARQWPLFCAATAAALRESTRKWELGLQAEHGEVRGATPPETKPRGRARARGRGGRGAPRPDLPPSPIRNPPAI